MKKILTAITATAILATSAFSAEIFNQNKSYLCDNITDQKLEKTIKSEDFNIIYKLSSDQNNVAYQALYYGAGDGIEESMKKNYGDLSIDFLKNMGMGTNTKLTYKNLYYNYLDFLLYTYNKNTLKVSDLQELYAFYAKTYYEINKKEDDNKYFKDEKETVRFYTVFFMKELDNLDFYNFMKYANKNNKTFNEFFKYVALKDYERAYNFIKEENKNSYIYDSIFTLYKNCQIENYKTVEDVFSK